MIRKGPCQCTVLLIILEYKKLASVFRQYDLILGYRMEVKSASHCTTNSHIIIHKLIIKIKEVCYVFRFLVTMRVNHWNLYKCWVFLTTSQGKNQNEEVALQLPFLKQKQYKAITFRVPHCSTETYTHSLFPPVVNFETDVLHRACGNPLLDEFLFNPTVLYPAQYYPGK